MADGKDRYFSPQIMANARSVHRGVGTFSKEDLR